MGKECMARLSRRLWGETSLKTAAKEASGPWTWGPRFVYVHLINYRYMLFLDKSPFFANLMTVLFFLVQWPQSLFL